MSRPSLVSFSRTQPFKGVDCGRNLLAESLEVIFSVKENQELPALRKNSQDFRQPSRQCRSGQLNLVGQENGILASHGDDALASGKAINGKQ